MKHRVRATEGFRADLRAQLTWLVKSDQEGWIEGLQEGLDEAFVLLEKHPGVGALEATAEDGDLRRLILRRVPYVLWYATERGSRSDVWLLRLFHTRQARPSPSWPPIPEQRRARKKRR